MFNDPNEIANLLQLELNVVINSIAPSKTIQYKKNYQPFIDNNIREQMNNTQILLNKAIETQEFSDWTEYKNSRNITQKQLKLAKKNYTIAKFKKSRDKWATVKNLNKTKTQHPPSKITHNNKTITSPKDICIIANQFFTDKINEIRSKFYQPSCKPIEILEQLIPRNKNEMVIPLITISQVVEIIKNLPETNSTGFDDITNSII